MTSPVCFLPPFNSRKGEMSWVELLEEWRSCLKLPSEQLHSCRTVQSWFATGRRAPRLPAFPLRSCDKSATMRSSLSVTLPTDGSFHAANRGKWRKIQSYNCYLGPQLMQLSRNDVNPSFFFGGVATFPRKFQTIAHSKQRDTGGSVVQVLSLPVLFSLCSWGKFSGLEKLKQASTYFFFFCCKNVYTKKQ